MGLYQASNFGRVRSVDRTRTVAPSRQATNGFFVTIKGKVLKPTPNINKKGKARAFVLRLRKDGKYHFRSVHELVLSTFVGPRPEGHYGCHKDDVPANNRLTNLYWGTPTQNCADKIRLGNQQRGAEIPWSKLTESDVRFIKANAGITTQNELARRFGVTQSRISRIVNGKQWRHI